MRAVVAMSGGVDSSVAAALLLEEGYDVVGVTMNLFSLPKQYCRDEELKSCCGWGAAEDAHQVSLQLGIPHYVIDVREEFEKWVISNFCAEYKQGRTPNPCLRCNEFIKFDELMQRADRLDAEYVATGHHARIDYDTVRKKFLLKKGMDRQKDQSYFLYTLTQSLLRRILMPVGTFTKKDVRKKAAELGLTAAGRPESQEICFVPDKDYTRFLQSRIPQAFRPGPVVDSEGKTIGRHSGIPGFTIGQRRGLGIAAARPLYVLAIDAETNTVVAGFSEGLFQRVLEAKQVKFIAGKPVHGPLRVMAKIRYKHQEAPAVMVATGEDSVRITFETAQRAVAPGQAVVFYAGETVIGGGLIEKQNLESTQKPLSRIQWE